MRLDPKKLPISYLEDLQEHFKSKFSEVGTLIPNCHPEESLRVDFVKATGVIAFTCKKCSHL